MAWANMQRIDREREKNQLSLHAVYFSFVYCGGGRTGPSKCMSEFHAALEMSKCQKLSTFFHVVVTVYLNFICIYFMKSCPFHSRAFVCVGRVHYFSVCIASGDQTGYEGSPKPPTRLEEHSSNKCNHSMADEQ